jgi:hypothetical protein
MMIIPITTKDVIKTIINVVSEGSSCLAGKSRSASGCGDSTRLKHSISKLDKISFEFMNLNVSKLTNSPTFLPLEDASRPSRKQIDKICDNKMREKLEQINKNLQFNE